MRSSASSYLHSLAIIKFHSIRFLCRTASPYEIRYDKKPIAKEIKNETEVGAVVNYEFLVSIFITELYTSWSYQCIKGGSNAAIILRGDTELSFNVITGNIK